MALRACAGMFLSLSSVLACSGSDERSRAGEQLGAGGTAGGQSVDPLELAPPERGFQVEIPGTSISAGQDVEYCQVVAVPGSPSDVYYTNRLEAALTPYSHHLNVYAVDPDHAVDEEVDVGDFHECLQPTLGYSSAGVNGEGFTLIAGSQGRYTDNRLPEGVGKKLFGGQKLIFNYHYLNTTSEAVPARSKLNVHTVDSASVIHRPQVFTLLNQTIVIPPRQTASFTMECVMRQDIVVFGLSRHTHRWGTDFEVWSVGGERDGARLFLSTDWEAGTGYKPEPPMLVRAGEGFRFRCDFDNTTDGTMRWGDSARDEMCILYGAWYVANQGEVPAAQSCIAFEGAGGTGPDGVVRGVPISWPAPDRG